MAYETNVPLVRLKFSDGFKYYGATTRINVSATTNLSVPTATHRATGETLTDGGRIPDQDSAEFDVPVVDHTGWAAPDGSTLGGWTYDLVLTITATGKSTLIWSTTVAPNDDGDVITPDDGTLTTGGAAATTFPRSGPARRLTSRLDMGASANLGFAGDSLGTEPTEYPALISEWFAEQYPDLRVIRHSSPDDTGVYGTTTVVQEGATPELEPAVHDDFTYTAAELFGATPSIAGQPWGVNGGDGHGDWTVDGAGAVATADTTNGVILGTEGHNGDHLIEATYVPNPDTTLGGTATATMSFYLRYVSLGNNIRVRIVRGATEYTANIVAIVGGSGRTLGSFTAPIPADGVYNVSARAGVTTWAEINGQRIEGVLSDADIAATSNAGGAQFGFGKSGANLTGDRITRFWGAYPDTAVAQILTVYNGCKASTTFEYQRANLAALYPVPLDLMIASSSHNYGAQDAATYMTSVTGFATETATAHPDAGFVFSSQNPETDPVSAGTRARHMDRNLALADWVESNGYGYIPGTEFFLANRDQWGTWIDPDGVHPTKGTGSGSEAWAGLMIDYLAAYRVA